MHSSAPSHAGQDQGALWGLSFGTLMPFVRVPPSRPTQFPKTHLLIKSSLGRGSQHKNLGGDTNIQTVTGKMCRHKEKNTSRDTQACLILCYWVCHTHIHTNTPFSRCPPDRILQTICHSKHSWLCPSRDDPWANMEKGILITISVEKTVVPWDEESLW